MWPYKVVVGHTAKQLKALNDEDKGVQGLSPDTSEALNRFRYSLNGFPTSIHI